MESIVENRKVFKRNKILNLIRTHEDCSRCDIKKMTSYSMATVLSVVDELVAGKYIIETESQTRNVGRKPALLRINSDYGYFVGLEFHATQINCATLDFLGRIIHRSNLPIVDGDDVHRVLEKLRVLIADAIEQSAKPPLGIGVGVPGYYDAANGIGNEYKLIPGWCNVPVRDFVEAHFHVPCFIENNVTAMAIGYQYDYLQGDVTKDFLFASIRSGVRLVAVADNALYLCNNGYAGQLGHVKIREGGSRMCLCGKRGCLNTEVADTGLKQKILEDIAAGKMQHIWGNAGKNPENVTIPLYVDSVLSGNGESLNLLNQTADYLGRALGMMTDILAPSQIVVYGELARCHDFLLRPLRHALCENAMPDNTQHLALTLCAPDERLGAYGAARLVMRKMYEFIKETV
ncbi:MAG: ROK family protein [Clostridia bacterium]